MNKYLSFGNSKNMTFKQTVLKNAYRLKKFNSLKSNDSIQESPKCSKNQSIRQYLMIPKQQIDLTVNQTEIINKENISHTLYTEKRNYSKKIMMTKLLETQSENNEKNEDENICFKTKHILSVNDPQRFDSYIDKNNISKVIFKKKCSKIHKVNFDTESIDNLHDKQNNFKTIKQADRRKRKLIDLKQKVIIWPEKEKNEKIEENKNEKTNSINTINNINNNNKSILIQKCNTIFNTYKNKTIVQAKSMIFNKKTFFRKNNDNLKNDAKLNNENNGNSENINFKLNHQLSLGWLFFSKANNDSYNHTIDSKYLPINNSQEAFSKYNTQAKISSNTPRISSYKGYYESMNRNKLINNEKTGSFILTFFEDNIGLVNSFNSKTYFNYFINCMNKKYLIAYETKLFKHNNNEHFIYCYKYYCAILVMLIFLAKDDDLFEKKSKNSKILFTNFILSSLWYTGYHFVNSQKLKLFLSKNNEIKKMKISDCALNLLNLNFKDRKDYSLLYSIMMQLIDNLNKDSIVNILSIINNSILYCLNTGLKTKLYMDSNICKKNEFFFNFKDEKYEKQIEDNIPPPSVPFIKKQSKKKFCLVLDLDETIIHSVKLKNGYYFFVRPGAIQFLNEISPFYEIIFFTSSYKPYADYILNKIDLKKNLISYRFYKSHVIFEKGRSIKKLSLIGRDLKKIIFVDNLKTNAKYNKKNLYLITTWLGDMKDDEIYKLKKKLFEISANDKYNDDITKALINEGEDNNNN